MIPSYLYLNSFPTGSNYICNPPVTDTDIDYMFLVHNLQETKTTLLNDGWTLCGVNEDDQYDIDGNDWMAFRKGTDNALCTTNMKYYLDFYKATEEAKRLNLLKKEDRIALFQKITGRMPKEKGKPQLKCNIEQHEWFLRAVEEANADRVANWGLNWNAA